MHFGSSCLAGDRSSSEGGVRRMSPRGLRCSTTPVRSRRLAYACVLLGYHSERPRWLAPQLQSRIFSTCILTSTQTSLLFARGQQSVAMAVATVRTSTPWLVAGLSRTPSRIYHCLLDRLCRYRYRIQTTDFRQLCQGVLARSPGLRGVEEQTCSTRWTIYRVQTSATSSR